MDIYNIITFLGWCTVLNFSIVIFAAIFFYFFKDFSTKAHSKLTGVNAAELPTLYFSYMANYKIAIFIFNLVPYIALKLVFNG